MNYEWLLIFLNKWFGPILNKFHISITTDMMLLNSPRRFNIPLIYDYVRVSTLELISREIYSNKILGSVAELGVFRGNFARYINLAFPDRTFYLFDTFEGFDKRDVLVEQNGGFSSGEQDFSKTNIELVLKKMKNRQNCVIKQGYFPQSLHGLEDKYCFVSLDVDLYQPTYEGLKYFYERLNKGGYIFIHDFNSRIYTGVRNAINKFVDEVGINYIPMSDAYGSVIIKKR